MTNVLRLIYIETISHRTSSETISNSQYYLSDISWITDKLGYSMSSSEPFDGVSTFEKTYKIKSDDFEFGVSISNMHDTVEYIHVYFDDNGGYIDYDVLLKVFNCISACNISKYEIYKCHKNVQRGKDYEKSLIWLSDKCSIYGSSKNKSICITGVPGFGF